MRILTLLIIDKNKSNTRWQKIRTRNWLKVTNMASLLALLPACCPISPLPHDRAVKGASFFSANLRNLWVRKKNLASLTLHFSSRMQPVLNPLAHRQALLCSPYEEGSPSSSTGRGTWLSLFFPSWVGLMPCLLPAVGQSVWHACKGGRQWQCDVICWLTVSSMLAHGYEDHSGNGWTDRHLNPQLCLELSCSSFSVPLPPTPQITYSDKLCFLDPCSNCHLETERLSVNRQRGLHWNVEACLFMVKWAGAGGNTGMALLSIMHASPNMASPGCFRQWVME